MPRFNGRGPLGEGAMTGRGMGNCNTSDTNTDQEIGTNYNADQTRRGFGRFFGQGYGSGRRFGGRGRGEGRGRGFCRY